MTPEQAAPFGDWRQIIQRMEASGEMGRRRDDLRRYFLDQPASSVRDACRHFGWTVPDVPPFMDDYMYFLADGARGYLVATGQISS